MTDELSYWEQERWIDLLKDEILRRFDPSECITNDYAYDLLCDASDAIAIFVRGAEIEPMEHGVELPTVIEWLKDAEHKHIAIACADNTADDN